VDAWLATDAANVAFLRQLKAAVGEPQPSMDVDARWQDLRSRLATASPNWPRRLVFPVAAAAALLLWVTWPRGEVNEMVQLAASLGAPAWATLPDGSTILLAPGGQASWSSLVRAERDVQLVGEAYFVVKHDTRPFRVFAGRAVVQDIGTRFTVRALPGDSLVAVAVEEGEVAVSDSSRHPLTHGVRLVAGQATTVDPRGVVASISGADEALAWVRGELVWHEAPLAEVARTIERWYNVRVRVDSALAGRRVLARLQRRPVDEVLQSVAAAIGVRVSGGEGQWSLTGESR
jgi:ferric-dicitrate binding protein FerR (iron transport regulator)